MTRAAILAPLALVGAALLAGCGVTTTDKVYDQALIREVGAGSMAELRINQSIRPGHLPQPFTQGDSNTIKSVLSNRLEQVTLAQVESARVANARALPQFDRSASNIAEAAKQARESVIDVSTHPDISSGARGFVGHWNEVLGGAAGAEQTLARAVRGARPLFAHFDNCLRQAAIALRGGGSAGYARVCSRLVDEAKGDVTKIATAAAGGAALDKTGKEFIDFVNHNQDAQAIVEQVNKQYPNGYLAQAAKGKG